MPVAVRPAPATAICEICALALPVLVMVTVRVAEEPVLTLPKFTLLVLNVKIPAAATPVPLRAMLAGEFGALLVTVTVPLRLPAVVGEKIALNVVLAPIATVTGVVRPPTLKPAPLAESCEIVSAALPVLVSVNTCDLVCPSRTLP